MTHVDYSARIDTVHAETNPRFHALLSIFKQRTDCVVLLNTSFNVRSEPIAFRCFMGTEMENARHRQLHSPKGGAKSRLLLIARADLTWIDAQTSTSTEDKRDIR